MATPYGLPGLPATRLQRTWPGSTRLQYDAGVQTRLLFVLTAVALATAVGCGGRQPTATPVAGSVRVASLAPSLTEILFAVGAGSNVVGRSSACDVPPEVKHIPVVGNFGQPSLEALLRQAPTAVVYVDLEDKGIPSALQRIGLRPVSVPCRTMDDVPPALRAIGQLTGHSAQAEALAEQFETQLAALRRDIQALENPRPKVYAEIWSDPVMAVGRRSFIAEIIRLAGGQNVGDDIDRDYFQASTEWVLQRDPDVILCLYMTPAGSAAEKLKARPGWNVVRAIRTGRVYSGLDNDVLLRPGPRALEGVEAVRRCLVGEGPER